MPDPLVERDEQAIRVRPAIHEQATAGAALEEHGVALPDVEDREDGAAPDPIDDGDPAKRQGRDGPERDHDQHQRATDRRRSPLRIALQRLRSWLRPTATAMEHDAGDPERREHTRQPRHSRRDVDRREWDVRGKADDPGDRGQREPRGETGHRADHRRCSGEDQCPAGERDDPGRHRQRHQWDHGEVHDRRDQRQPPERGDDDRQRRSLGGQRHAEALHEPPRSWPPASRSSRVVSGDAQASSPAVATTDSWKPASATSAASTTSSTTTADPSAAAARPPRPAPRASSTIPAITAARPMASRRPRSRRWRSRR